MAGGTQAKMSTWFTKPNQSLISKVTKKRVGFNLKIFVFALLKTVHCRIQPERNPGRIGRLFNCNDRCFFIWREAPKPKTWFSKPWISNVTKKRVGFNLKIFVFALLKTVQNRAERNPGRIGRLFNCNDRCFFIWREAPKPKCLPGLVSPIKVWFQRWPKKGSDSTWKFLCLRSWKLSIAGLSGILDVLGDYLTAMTGVFSYGGRRPSQNVYLV